MNQVKAGVPWLMLATVLLAVLNSIGTINVSWWIVFMPMLLPLAVLGGILGIGVIAFIIFLIGAGIYYLCGGR